MVFAACNRPRTIPDDKLEAIVTEVFLSNAFYQGHYTQINLDSMELYRPIFEKYGYTPQDMLYTIDGLSRRKSIRFTDIMDNAIAAIERDSRRYDSLVAIRDTIDARIAERFRKVVHTDTLHHITSFKAAKAFEIRVPLERGRYTVEFVYKVDSTDKNAYIQYYQYTLDTMNIRNNTITRTYSRLPDFKRENITFTIDDPKIKELVINPVRIPSEEARVTNVSFDSLRITRYLLVAEGRDSLLRQIFDYNRELLNEMPDDKPAAKDYVTLRPHAARVDTGSDTLVRSAGQARGYIYRRTD